MNERSISFHDSSAKIRMMRSLVLLVGGATIAQSKMNVLMIAVDDLRPQLACVDAPGSVRPNGGMHTPNICAFSKDALVLLRSQVAMAT
jgi:hypothetical protein